MFPIIISPTLPQDSLRRTQPVASKNALKPSLSISSRSRDGSDSASASSSQHATPDIDYMEPAIDGPPSPERLRQLSKQMKRSSYLTRPKSRRNQSSGSSPRREMERSPWEQAFDSISLSRQPSNRSTTSSDPSRESVQMLGKNLFQRGHRSKRASSSHSSSNSSLYSAEIPSDLASKDSLLPSLFTRRKPSRDETAQKKVQISGPFNFHHVTHTQRENLPDLQRSNTIGLGSEFSTIRTPDPTSAPRALKIDAHDIHHFSNGPIDPVDSEYDHAALAALPSRPSLLPRHTAPSLGSRRGMRLAKSQDQLRCSPPRSSPRARASTETGIWDPTNSPPMPPPRMSSRQSIMPDGFSAFASASLERPRTSGGFRQPQPYDPSEPLNHSPPPATSHGFIPPADFQTFGVDEKRFSHALTTPDDAAWPLSASPSHVEKFLPDVPEEEEQYGALGRSRLSLASNNSSLRGSQSVPALRSFLQSQRPMSGASDTLGPFDVAAAQGARKCGNEDPRAAEAAALHDNWEDDIDYCYEHEAEANFDYQWERTSLDTSYRHPAALPLQGAYMLPDDELAEANPAIGVRPSATMVVDNDADVLPQSPPRHHTPGAGPESLSPNSHMGATSNFSLPRGDKGTRVSQLKGIRPVSYASSFRECHGFNLSPSLLIPGDYHQQMLAEKYDYHDDEILGGPFHDEISLGSDTRSPLAYEQRSSTSTTETFSTTHTDTTGERHASANSTFTTMTRLTVSSSDTSLNKAAGVIAESIEPMPTTQFIDTRDEDGNDQEPTPPGTKDTVPELTPFPTMNFAKKPHHRSHASESLARDEITPLKSQDSTKVRRPRARTSSLSTQIAPPVGQYALFPRSYIKGNGDRI